MAETCGDPAVVIGLIDGPVAVNHPDLTPEKMRFSPRASYSCFDPDTAACRHGTFIAGLLNADRSSETPGICPGCTLLIRPVFLETESDDAIPATTALEVASAIIECVDHGAHVLNLSIALEGTSGDGDRALNDALDYAARQEVIVAAAAGNQGPSPARRSPGTPG